MDYLRLVHIFQCQQEIVQHGLNMDEIKAHIVLVNLLQIAVGLFHYNVELVEILGIRWLNYVDQLNHTWV